MAEDRIAVSGVVGSTPKHVVTAEGLAITSFRLASTARRYDRAAQEWIDGDTNWFTVTAFRSLAMNVAASVAKGERVAVHGKLRIRPWSSGERSGTEVEIEADSIGHDLTWGTSQFTRSISRAAADRRDEQQAASAASVPDSSEDAAAVPDGWSVAG